MLRVKNFVPAISLEGFEDANDGRRGQGVYEKVRQAMALLKAHGLPFGISTCYTSANWQDVSSEAYFDEIIEAGRAVHLVLPLYAGGRRGRTRRADAPRRSSAPRCTNASVPSARPGPSSAWTSRTTPSMSAAALPAGGATCTSTRAAMSSPACSSTIPM